jgi:hypothetical protein
MVGSGIVWILSILKAFLRKALSEPTDSNLTRSPVKGLYIWAALHIILVDMKL